MRNIFILCVMALMSFACAAAAQPKGCDMDIDFADPTEAEYWQAVNDGVMGGRSSGGPDFKDGYMRFEGVINTNGGGFSSLRTYMKPGDLSTATGLQMRLRTDGRAYKVTLRTNVTYRGRRVAFQTAIPKTKKGEWADVFVPFDRLEATIFGRKLRGGNFEPSDVQQLGIILSDGKDGPFRLDIKRIEGCVSE